MSQIQYENPVEQVMYILGYKHNPQYETPLHAIVHGADPGKMNAIDNARVYSHIHANFIGLKEALNDIENSRGFDKLTAGFKEEIFKLILDEVNEEKYGGKWFGTDRILDENWVDMSQYSDLFSQENKKFCLPRPYVVLLNPILETRAFVESNHPILDVNLGKQINGENLNLDFEKQKIHLTLLLGATGTGKSVLHYHIYKQLVDQNSSDEIGFVLIDNTRVDFSLFNKLSTYLYVPISSGGEQSLNILDGLASRLEEINKGQKHIFIHIEECDLFCSDPVIMQKAFTKLLKNKENSKIHIIFSTSRPGKDIITPWLLELTDLKIITRMASSVDYITTTGKDYTQEFANYLGEEKLVILKDKFWHLLPLSAAECSLAEDFKL